MPRVVLFRAGIFFFRFLDYCYCIMADESSNRHFTSPLKLEMSGFRSYYFLTLGWPRTKGSVLNFRHPFGFFFVSSGDMRQKQADTSTIYVSPKIFTDSKRPIK